MNKKLLAAAIAGVLAFGVAPAAHAAGTAEPYVSIGDAHVLKVGDPAARRVVVLVSGWYGAANGFRELARDLAARTPGTQVWAVDRREQRLADFTGFRTKDPATYYLDGRYQSPKNPEKGPGLRETLDDLRTVVLKASDHGRRQVVLGGHSWGATTALAYAAWDFHGRPGYRDLDGLVLIDGGVHGAFAGEGGEIHNSPEEIKARLAELDQGEPFETLLSLGTGLGAKPESAAIWYQLIAWYAHHAPHEPSVLVNRLPEKLRPPRPVTNAGLLGWLVQAAPGTSPALAVVSGRLGEDGDWIDDGMTPLSRVAEAMAGPKPGTFEWYWPKRLTIDLDAVDPYADTESAKLLDLRLWHAREVNVPLYAFETGLDKGTELTAARWVVEHSRIKRATYAGDRTMNHLDPLFAAPDRNELTRTLVPFLRDL
ncbi:alpha/beta hydrolase [Nonomuraea sediminis]|uniref:alpha/beta hydrolase n=1 Tax=Nonomuraea sediminis TaxID=2835864 RepID=UPI001BDCAD2D|nr:alpha/beta fold hydrolase [Nonomuraea sediminis]